MPNPRRGEVALTLAGRSHTLCLTFGALAEIEAAFGADDLAALGERLSRRALSARDLVRLLGPALRGGGHDLCDAEVAALPLAGALPEVVAALETAFALAFGAPSAPRGAPCGEGALPPS
jgi:hypothetical protein